MKTNSRLIAACLGDVRAFGAGSDHASPSTRYAGRLPGCAQTLDKKGDYNANVFKVNIPRNDLSVTVDGVDTPTPFGFGGG